MMVLWTGQSGLWHQDANWSGSNPNAMSAVATFDEFQSSFSSTAFVTLNSPVYVGRLEIFTQNHAVKILPVSGLGHFYLDNQHGPAVIDVDTNGVAGSGLFNGTESDLLVFLGSNTTIITRNTDTVFTIDGSVKSNGHIDKYGSGTLVLTGDNDFTRGIDIWEGIVEIAGDSALGTGLVTLRGTIAGSDAILTNPIQITHGGGRFVAKTGETLTLDISDFATSGEPVLSSTRLGSSQSGLDGTVILSFNAFPVASHFDIYGPVQMGDAANAARIFRDVERLQVFAEGSVDTNGFSTSFAKSVFSGTLFSSTGALDARFTDSFSVFGTVVGSDAPDSLEFRLSDHTGVNAFNATFVDWTEGSDRVRIYGSDAANSLTGSPVSDLILGRAGADSIYGAAGNDTLDGGIGADSMEGGVGDDVFRVDDAGDVVTELSGQGADTVSTRLASYTLPDHVENLVLRGVDQIGIGNTSSNEISSRRGDDSLWGGNGNDRLVARGGDDTLVGGDRSDTLYGGSGNDDLLGGDGFDQLFGGSGDDMLDGNRDDDELRGQFGHDDLDGAGGNDSLYGGDGSDTIVGGPGEDIIYAGRGRDLLTGGEDADTFRFQDDAQFNTITDFEIGTDQIHLRSYRAENGGGQLTFDQLLITQTGADTRIQLDLDRNGVADVIDLDGDGTTDGWSLVLLDTDASAITAADFVL